MDNPRRRIALIAAVAAGMAGMMGGASVVDDPRGGVGRQLPTHSNKRGPGRAGNRTRGRGGVSKAARQYAKRYANFGSMRLGKKANSPRSWSS